MGLLVEIEGGQPRDSSSGATSGNTREQNKRMWKSEKNTQNNIVRKERVQKSTYIPDIQWETLNALSPNSITRSRDSVLTPNTKHQQQQSYYTPTYNLLYTPTLRWSLVPQPPTLPSPRLECLHLVSLPVRCRGWDGAKASWGSWRSGWVLPRLQGGSQTWSCRSRGCSKGGKTGTFFRR